MKVAIIAHDYNPGTAGGIETYFLDLVESLQNIDNKNEYTIFLNRNGYKKVQIHSKNFSKKVVNITILNRILRKFIPQLDRKLGYSGRVNDSNFDVVHFPFQVINIQGIKARKVVSIMDIQQEYWPQFFSKEDLKARALAFRPSIDQADAVISISDFTRDTIIEKYKTDPSKIKTVHLAYDKSIFNTNNIKKDKLSLPEKYFYYPAASWPHKNHTLLIEAFSKYSGPEDFCLVLSGIKKQEHDEISAKIEELGLKDRVIMLGYLDYTDLPEVYRRAYALIFPSLFEGFGIPVLEAMACGCPVVCSDTTSLPEVAGNAALYFNPTDRDSIISAMIKISKDDKFRSELIKKGFKRVTLFSNERMAKETLNVYTRVVSE